MNAELEIAVAWRATVAVATRRNRARAASGLPSFESDLAVIAEESLNGGPRRNENDKLVRMPWAQFEALRARVA